jgi:hypothetical protein
MASILYRFWRISLERLILSPEALQELHPAPHLVPVPAEVTSLGNVAGMPYILAERVHTYAGGFGIPRRLWLLVIDLLREAVGEHHGESSPAGFVF